MISIETVVCVKMFSMEIGFSEWINQELNKRGWNQSELARRADISRGTLANIMNGNRGIGPETCTAIAEAMDLPAIEVFRAAGLLPQATGITPLQERALYYLSQLLPEDQERVMLYLEVLASRYRFGGERP